MNIKKFIAASVILSMVVACQQGMGGARAGYSDKGQVVGITAGTLLGGMKDKSISALLDKSDLAAYHQSSQNALENTPTGEVSTWKNPDSGHFGTITPTSILQSDGTYCREYRQTINAGGRAEEGYGTACRQQDGSWRVKE